MLQSDKKSFSVFCLHTKDFSVRLDKYLFDLFPNYSRSYFQKLIRTNNVHVNAKIVTKGSYLVNKNDNIDILFAQHNTFTCAPEKIDFAIIAEHKDFLVINKPAGLVVHNTHINSEEPSLVKGLLYYFQELCAFDDKERPGIVHRLDKDTSGLILVARNQIAQIKLSNLFKDRKIHKTYCAVVKGHPDKTGCVTYDIGRHPVHRHKMSHLGICSRSALTNYNVLAYYKETTLVAASPVTGRTHQIRVHLASIGHGILGDATYGVQSKLIKRQALHAWKLEFEYEGQTFAYSLPVPRDFSKLLKTLEK